MDALILLMLSTLLAFEAKQPSTRLVGTIGIMGSFCFMLLGLVELLVRG